MPNHSRLDQITNWSCYLKCGATAAEELEAFRKLDKYTRAQKRRVEHLQRHVDAGDVICNCYEEVRTDLLGS